MGHDLVRDREDTSNEGVSQNKELTATALEPSGGGSDPLQPPVTPTQSSSSQSPALLRYENSSQLGGGGCTVSHKERESSHGEPPDATGDFQNSLSTP